MKIKQFSVNSNGIAQIHVFLAANHKLGGDHFNQDMLRAWASDAEFQLSECNTASIEIRACDSLHGHTQEFTISDEGLDVEELEIEE